jgi:ribosomal protein S1
MMGDKPGWEAVKVAFPIGTRVRGTVVQHAPYGVFVDVPGIPFKGLVQITDFRDSGRMTPAEYPAVGSVVEAVVLGFKEIGNQVWLGMRASQLCRSHPE